MLFRLKFSLHSARGEQSRVIFPLKNKKNIYPALFLSESHCLRSECSVPPRPEILLSAHSTVLYVLYSMSKRSHLGLTSTVQHEQISLRAHSTILYSTRRKFHCEFTSPYSTARAGNPLRAHFTILYSVKQEVLLRGHSTIVHYEPDPIAGSLNFICCMYMSRKLCWGLTILHTYMYCTVWVGNPNRAHTSGCSMLHEQNILLRAHSTICTVRHEQEIPFILNVHICTARTVRRST